MKKNILLITCFSFLGGMCGSIVMQSGLAQAALSAAKVMTLEAFSSRGNRIAYMGQMDHGAGSIFLFDEKGQTDVQLGSYPAGGERGQPLIGLNDKNNNLRYLMRLHGAQDSPVLVLKDMNGRDRITIGLDGNTGEPFIKVMDNSGYTKDLAK